MPDKAHTETELKFALSPEAQRKLLAAVKAAPRQVDLRAVYFDTPDGRLKTAGYSLRVRVEGEHTVQTLKWRNPANPTDRREWEGEIGGPALDPNLLVGTPLAAVLDGKLDRLSPAFTVEVKRQIVVRRKGASRIELAFDSGQIIAGTRSEPIAELELELKSGQVADLFSLARQLAKTAPAPLLFDSKSQRGYALVEGGLVKPLKPTVTLRAKASVSEAIGQIGWACLHQVAANAELVRVRGSIEALHQARVGLRRLRAALTAFHDIAGGTDFDSLEVETKWLARQLDEARDLDVFIQDTFTAAHPSAKERAAYAKLGARLLGAQTRAYRHAVGALESPRYAALLLEAAAWLEAGQWRRSNDPVVKTRREGRMSDYAMDQLGVLRHKVLKRAKGFSRLDERDRHRLRIAAKKLRYAAEFFSGALGHKPGKGELRFRKSLEAMQEELGALNDIAVAHALALELANDQTAEIGLAAGLAAGARAGELDRRLEAAARTVKDFRKAQPFWR